MDKKKKRRSGGRLKFKPAEVKEPVNVLEPGARPIKKPSPKKPVVDPVDVPVTDPVADPVDPKPAPDGKLKFTKEEKRGAKEKTKTEKLDREAGKTEAKADKYRHKRDKYHDKQPIERKRVKERYFDDKTGKSKTRLVYEEKAIPINEAKWNMPKKKSLPRKAVGLAATAGVNKLHSKVYEIEHENVGTQAGHQAELIGESVFRGGKKLTRSAYRFVRNTPYRREAKFEVKSIKARSKLEYQKALRDNPKLRSNPISRMWQKHSIKKQYADARKAAKKSGKAAEKAAGTVKKAGQAVTKVVRKNPILLLKAAILLLIIMMLMALLSMCATLFSGGSGIVGGAVYAAGDADIDNAELAYTEWETDLQIQISNAESSHSGYDEYRYRVGDIGHDPFELIGFLTAVYEDFNYYGIEGVLRGIFNEQYQLDFVPEVEIRTRTETRTGTSTYTDPVTGETYTETYTYEVEVEYEYYILNVVLTSQPFYLVIYPRMDADQREHFEILMITKGARQYVGNPFDINWLPYVSSNYGYRVHPITGAKDYHKGIDIARTSGTEILAGFDGTVTTAAYDGSYGNYVVIETVVEDGKTLEAKYAHCNTLLVTVGQTVKTGDVIATVGSTGSSTGPHLHMEVVKDGQYLNPIFFVVTGDDGSGRIPPGTPGGIVIPPYSGEPMGDGTYAALLAEAQKYIGYPYVWGGSHPSTSFDCFGYICWILNQSGAASVGRTTAQGLFNLSVPVSLADAKPGDLLFFTKTYSTPNPVTHVALYLGGDLFIHCGDPIGYGNLSSSYWQSHFYAVGRICNY